VTEMGREAARRLAARTPAEMGAAGGSNLTLTVLEEDGTEASSSSRTEFWDALRGTRDAFKHLSAGEGVLAQILLLIIFIM
jgi:hypothetical protein